MARISPAMRKILEDLQVPEVYRDPLDVPVPDKKSHQALSKNGGFYSPELAREICDRIAGGEKLEKLVGDPRMPSAMTLIRWRAKYPEFHVAYSDARERAIELHGIGSGKAGLPFNQKVAEEICARVEEGESMDALCADPEMPSWRTICRWRRDNAAFGSAYAAAREISAEACEHNAIREAQTATSKETYAAAKVRSEIWRWTAAIRNPKTHGNKVELNASVEIGLADRLNAALARRVIDVTPEMLNAVDTAMSVAVLDSAERATVGLASP